MIYILFLLFITVVGTGYWLKYLNLSYLRIHGHTVPPEFEGKIDPGVLRRISDYIAENNRIGLIESLADNFLLALFLFGGLLEIYDQWIASCTGSFIGAGVLFVLILLAVGTVLDIPFSLYSNFKIEKRYGFNTMTMRIWLADFIKSAIISFVLGAFVVMVILSIIQGSPVLWWLWVWLFLLLFGVFMMYVSPYIIEPLFFKFEPIKKEGLEEKIRTLAERAGIKVSKIFQVDASRRSRHSNAYFTGIGQVKRIVLFDTLIEQMTEEEILAVLAHEMGHWKKRHVIKRLIQTEAIAFCSLVAAFYLLAWEQLPALFNLADASFYVRVIIVGFLGFLVMFPLTPLFSYLSRRDEQEADRFAAELTGNPKAMASALVQLSKENLSNLHPHPLYAKFYYSHPPVVERIRKLRALSDR